MKIKNILGTTIYMAIRVKFDSCKLMKFVYEVAFLDINCLPLCVANGLIDCGTRYLINGTPSWYSLALFIIMECQGCEFVLWKWN